jgi:hypothetical protein
MRFIIGSLTLAFFFICGTAVASAQEELPNYNLDFMRSHTLSDVLRSGIRPWQTSEGVFVDGQQKWVTVFLRRRRSFKLLAETARFDVLNDYRVYRAEFASTIMPVTQGREAVYQVLRYLGLENDGINELIAGMGTVPDITKYWENSMTLDERVITVQVRPRVHGNQTGITFSVIINWPIPQEEINSLKVTEKLAPPPDFRKVSFEPPEDYEYHNPAPAAPVEDFEQQGLDVFDNRPADYYR